MNFFSLGDSSPELTAAVHLAQVGNVQVGTKGETTKLESLYRIGFFNVPNSIECCVALPLDLNIRPRQWYRNLQQSMKYWHQSECHLHLTTVENLGIDRLINELYFPIFVPNFYARGISPYGTHNLTAFRKMVSPKFYVALVQQGERTVGGGILRSRIPTPNAYILKKGNIPDIAAEGVEGMIYALDEKFGSCRRAFLFHLCAAFSSIGMNMLSLGTDLFWFDKRYVPILLEKIHWADAVLANRTDSHILLAIHPSQIDEQHGMIVFAYEKQRIILRGYGHEGWKAALSLGGKLSRCEVVPCRLNND
jgi:hypothetical protein